MRGKVYAYFVYVYKYRITPAYAGKSYRVHAIPPKSAGSPPPMRGKESADSVPCHRRRITPAYAGKSCRPHSNIIVLGDHPRLCGEKHNARINRTGHVGSPPPMRGKDSHRSTFHSIQRITPAYAGKRRCGQHSTGQRQDHPRLCGEKFDSWGTLIWILGSPPPMRGKVLFLAQL